VSRAVPPPEHLDYLQQIGVDVHSPSLSVAVPRAPAALASAPAPVSPLPTSPSPARSPVAVSVGRHPARRPAERKPTRPHPVPSPRRLPTPRHLPTWWPIVEWAVALFAVAAAVVLLVMLLMARGVLAQELPAPTAVATSASPSPEELPAVQKRPSSKSSKPKAPSPKPQDSERAALPVQASAEPNVKAEADAHGESSSPEADASEARAPVLRPAPNAGAPAGRPAAGSVPLQKSSSGIETVVGMAFLSGLGYLAWDRRKLGSRLGRIEAALGLEAQITSPSITSVESEVPTTRSPEPPALLNAESPEAALGALIAEAKRRGVATLPRAATRSWGAGVASITGNVRKENQDAAIVFEVNSTAVLVVADGLGGLPHGKEAARLAVGAAALSAAEALGTSAAAPAHPELVAEQALLDSAAALCRQARAAGRAEPRDGFRSTLIVVVGTPSTYGYCYLGDGGGVVVRQAGTIDTFLVPQKADGIANVVAGSLGPVLQGTPVVGKLPRRAGDNLLVGTDGVFDRVPEGFAASVVRLLGSHNGDAQAVASLVVSDFASAKDGSMYVCDDNLSFAILCTPAPRATATAVTIQRPALARR